MLPFASYGQGQNRPFYDYGRKIHFGFALGSTLSTFKYEFNEGWYQQDTFLTFRQKRYPGLTLGAVADLHFGELADLRVIPTLIISQRGLTYTLLDSTAVKRDVESAIIELPVLFKFKSERVGNHRFYVIGGVKYGYDLSSDAKGRIDVNDPKIAISPHNLNYDYGVGMDLYFPFFKFSPEIRLSRSINNVLEQQNHVYSKYFDRFQSNFIYFSLYFEG